MDDIYRFGGGLTSVVAPNNNVRVAKNEPEAQNPSERFVGIRM